MNQLFDATIESISTRRDNTLKLAIGTQELDTDAESKLLALKNKYVKILISDENINSEQIKAVNELKTSVAVVRNDIDHLKKSIEGSDLDAFLDGENDGE